MPCVISYPISFYSHHTSLAGALCAQATDVWCLEFAWEQQPIVNHLMHACNHAGPAEAFNLFPKTATSQQARDKLNKKTDNLPTVAEAGKELVGGSDPIGASSPQDVGKAVAKYVGFRVQGFSPCLVHICTQLPASYNSTVQSVMRLHVFCLAVLI